MGAEKEERKKREVAREKFEKDRRREERAKFENKLMEELKELRNTIEAMKEEEGKLRQEVEELRKSVKEEKTSGSRSLRARSRGSKNVTYIQ